MEKKHESNQRYALMTLLMLCLLVFTLTVVYASLLDDWGGTKGFIFKIVAVASGGLGLLVGFLLIFDPARKKGNQ
jgi:hypothetical protein